jgi:hypothetical protein
MMRLCLIELRCISIFVILCTGIAFTFAAHGALRLAPNTPYSMLRLSPCKVYLRFLAAGIPVSLVAGGDTLILGVNSSSLLSLSSLYNLRFLFKHLNLRLVKNEALWGHCTHLSSDGCYPHWKVCLGICELLPHLRLYSHREDPAITVQFKILQAILNGLNFR